MPAVHHRRKYTFSTKLTIYRGTEGTAVREKVECMEQCLPQHTEDMSLPSAKCQLTFFDR